MKVASLTLDDGTSISGPSVAKVLEVLAKRTSRTPAAKTVRKAVKQVARKAGRMPIAERQQFGDGHMGQTFQRPGKMANTMYTLIGWSTERQGELGMTICHALLEKHHDGAPIRMSMKSIMDEMMIPPTIARMSRDRIAELRMKHAPYSAAMRAKYGWDTVIAEAH